MRLFNAFSISSSGMTAERLRMDIIANNLANINTTRTADGGPYRRQVPVFAEKLAAALKEGNDFRGRGVQVTAILRYKLPARMVYDPAHPDADEQGYVAMPNINVTQEMVNLIAASRSYESNVTTFNAAKQMALKALEIGRV